MATLDDILTAAKNIVTALNNASETYLNINGSRIAKGLTSASLVKVGPSRVATVSVIVAGSANGTIYDASVASATTNPIYVIQNSIGITTVNLPVVNGIVVSPGTGMTVTIGYS